MTGTCSDCRWWNELATNEKRATGACRINPPVAVVAVKWVPKWFGSVTKMRWHAEWPVTDEDDWCGEHQPKEPNDGE